MLTSCGVSELKAQSKLEPDVLSTSPSEPRLLPHTPSPSGILTVTIQEAAGLTAPDQSQEPSLSPECKGNSPVQSNECIRKPLPCALLDYEKSQVSTPSILGTPENPRWWGPEATCKFDVTKAASLTIYLYLDYMRPQQRIERVPLGVLSLELFQGRTVLGSQWLRVQQGTGRIRISLEYDHVQERIFEMDDTDFDCLSDSNNVWRAKKRDTQRQYAIKRTSSADFHHIYQAIHHPFIASPAFSIQSPKGLQIFTPLMTGGHLFNHLQRSHRFDVDRCRFYAASITCALEYLHDACDEVPLIKPGNVLLDACGYVTLCGFSLFTTHHKSEEQGERKLPEYPAPELLVGEGSNSGAANWWMLGILLYEMLTGMPPFYDDDRGVRRQNILTKPVRFPESIESSAMDFVASLLDRDPKTRLGTAGVADIKSHVFLEGLDWPKLLSKDYHPAFIPGHAVDTFKQNGLTPPALPKNPLYPMVCPHPVLKSPESEDTPREPDILETNQQGNNYELIWDSSVDSGVFYFSNPLTKLREPVRSKPVVSSPSETKKAITKSMSPTQSQMQDAMETALGRGYHRAVAQLLDHGIDLNFKVVINNTRTTPLYWAIEHGDVESVKLFLSKTRQNLHRVAGTQALGVAVDSKDAAIVREILAHGIYCDFEEDDRPPPRPSYCTGWELFELSDPEGFLRFLAPLVRAVKHGDIEIVRLLLENGANVNVAYHDVPWQFDSLLQDGKRIGFSCGRAVQLGMELERKEIVQLLLCSGADIGLKQPIWDRAGRDHRCEYVPRAIYQRVIHGLRNISDEARRDVS